MVTLDDVPSLRVVDLKAELKARELPINGLKAELAERLTAALKAEEADAGNEGGVPPAPAAGEPAETANAAADGAAADKPAEAEAAAGGDGATAQEEPPAAAETEAVTAEPAETAAAETAASEPPADGEPAKQAAEDAVHKAPAVTVAAAAAGMKEESAQEPPATVHKAEKASAAETASAAEGKPAAGGEKLTAPAATPAAADEEPAAAAVEAALPDAAPAAAPAPAAAAAAESVEPMLEDEAPEMDFDVDPEEEEAAKQAAKEAAKEDAKAAVKRGREKEPISSPRVAPSGEAAKRGSGELRPLKVQRTDASVPGSHVTPRRLSSHSNVPVATPAARNNVAVPPPNMEPTPALRIDGFMRPFTLPQAKALLSQQGATIREHKFWMPSIKTHCYVIFETVEQAETIRQALFNVQWPKDSQKRLQPKFVTVEEAEGVISGTAARPVAAPAPAQTAAGTPKAAPSESRRVVEVVDARKEILERRQKRESAVKTREPPRELELDDLFRKTETRPHLYWLPAQTSMTAAGSAAPKADGTKA